MKQERSTWKCTSIYDETLTRRGNYKRSIGDGGLSLIGSRNVSLFETALYVQWVGKVFSTQMSLMRIEYRMCGVEGKSAKEKMKEMVSS